MSWKLQVFIHGEYFGETVNAPGTTPAPRFEKVIPQSVAYFCVDCGEVWARLVVDDSATIWQIKTLPCSKCGIGRIWHDYGMSDLLTGALPKKLLMREFALAFDDPAFYFERPHALRRHITASQHSTLVSRSAVDKLLEF